MYYLLHVFTFLMSQHCTHLSEATFSYPTELMNWFTNQSPPLLQFWDCSKGHLIKMEMLYMCDCPFKVSAENGI